MTVLQHRYPNLHIGYARSLRRAMTDAEHKLWGVLKQQSISNLKWRRQQPVGPYIVDFYCSAKKLIIEVDGGQHSLSEKDLGRDEWLNQRSFSVLRFWNNEILNDLDAVFAAIVQRQSLIELPPSAFARKKRELRQLPLPAQKACPGIVLSGTRLGGAIR